MEDEPYNRIRHAYEYTGSRLATPPRFLSEASGWGSGTEALRRRSSPAPPGRAPTVSYPTMRGIVGTPEVERRCAYGSAPPTRKARGAPARAILASLVGRSRRLRPRPQPVLCHANCNGVREASASQSRNLANLASLTGSGPVASGLRTVPPLGSQKSRDEPSSLLCRQTPRSLASPGTSVRSRFGITSPI
jgi:hypothetical protein